MWHILVGVYPYRSMLVLPLSSHNSPFATLTPSSGEDHPVTMYNVYIQWGLDGVVCLFVNFACGYYHTSDVSNCFFNYRVATALSLAYVKWVMLIKK